MKIFFQRLSQMRTKTVVAVILVATLLLGIGLLSLWWWAGTKIEAVITQQFNEQQLMLARKIAENVETYVDFLELLAVTYTQEYLVEAVFPEHLDSFLKLQLQYLQAYGIVAIRHYNAQGQVQALYQPDKMAAGGVAPLAPSYLEWARNPANEQAVLLQQVFLLDFPDGSRRRVLGVLAPLYRSRPDATLPTRAEFDGVLQLIVDPCFIAKLATKDVRSGQTGYAWIIDQNGIFLAHYEENFIGQDHIAVRRQRNPRISFEKIDDIVSNRLLRGQEGCDSYFSGWHRDQIGQIKKLLAYTPITFQRSQRRGIVQVENPGRNLWGVGVAAPVEEVSGLVARLQWDQGLLLGLFFVILVGTSCLLIGAVHSWNQVLSQEVAEKTAELRRSHERLLRSERFAAVGQAASYVSHEIKNPLMVIGGFAQQLKRHPDLPPAAVTKLEIISEEVKRLENFLGELRDFTRPAPPVKKEADLNALVEQVAAMMQDAANDLNIRLIVRPAENLPAVSFDANQMKQVLINLIKNAMEALEAGGTITVSTAAENSWVTVSVHDSGKGIAPDVLPQIFNPFFTTKKTGTGLGLAVINKIIEDHHGNISVTSSPEAGTTFTVALPAGH